MKSYEAACHETESAALDAEKHAASLTKALHALVKAAREGNPAKIGKARELVATASKAASSSADVAHQTWTYSDEAITDYLDKHYEVELVKQGIRDGVRIDRLDDRLAAFPVIIQILSRQRAVSLDKRRIADLRPTHVISLIKAQQKKPSTKPEAFIETLFEAYRRVVGTELARGATMKQVHEVLTLLPEARRLYGVAEFARDVYLLDSSGIRETRKGVKVSFPAATGTKGGTGFLVVPPDGMVRYYYALRFEDSK